jgi:hypothetical protein
VGGGGILKKFEMWERELCALLASLPSNVEAFLTTHRS